MEPAWAGSRPEPGSSHPCNNWCPVQHSGSGSGAVVARAHRRGCGSTRHSAAVWVSFCAGVGRGSIWRVGFPQLCPRRACRHRAGRVTVGGAGAAWVAACVPHWRHWRCVLRAAGGQHRRQHGRRRASPRPCRPYHDPRQLGAGLPLFEQPKRGLCSRCGGCRQPAAVPTRPVGGARPRAVHNFLGRPGGAGSRADRRADC